MNYVSALIYCWRLQQVNSAYRDQEISQEQYKVLHIWAEQLNCRVCKGSRSKSCNLQRQMKQGYLFLVEAYKNIHCTYLDLFIFFSIRGMGEEDDTEVD